MVCPDGPTGPIGPSSPRAPWGPFSPVSPFAPGGPRCCNDARMMNDGCALVYTIKIYNFVEVECEPTNYGSTAYFFSYYFFLGCWHIGCKKLGNGGHLFNWCNDISAFI